MNTMDKIIYIADKTEENRTKINLEEAIQISNNNLDAGVYYIAKYMLNYSMDKRALIHPDTIKLMNKIIINSNKK